MINKRLKKGFGYQNESFFHNDPYSFFVINKALVICSKLVVILVVFVTSILIKYLCLSIVLNTIFILNQKKTKL